MGFDPVETTEARFISKQTPDLGSRWEIFSILLPFLALTLWIAFSLNTGVSPDEWAHYLFIKH